MKTYQVTESNSDTGVLACLRVYSILIYAHHGLLRPRRAQKFWWGAASRSNKCTGEKARHVNLCGLCK